MSYPVFGTSEDSIGQLIAGHLGRYSTKIVPPYSAIGWYQHHDMVAQAVFNNYTGSNIDIHIHGRLTKKRIKDAYTYVFNFLKCNRLTAMPYKDNEKLSSLLPRLGFVYECILRDYQGTADEPVDVKVYRLDKVVAMKWINTHG
jgi:hypothetical protein